MTDRPVPRPPPGQDWAATPLGPPETWPPPLRALVDVAMGSSQPMFVAWGPGRTLVCNDALATLLADGLADGLDHGHPGAPGRDALEVFAGVHADLGPRLERAFRGESVEVESIVLALRRGGRTEEAHLALSLVPVRDGSGAVAGVFGTGHDTTARVLAERRLRDSETRREEVEARATAEAERVRLALDAGAILGTWDWDLTTDRFTVDETFARSFGLDPALGREGLSLEQVVATVHPDDRPGLESAITEVTGRGGPYAHQYRVQRADGRFYWVEANGRVHLSADGIPLRFPGVLLDLEPRRAAEAARDRAMRLLKAFIEAVPGVVYAKDAEGRMLVGNRGTTELIGKPPEDYLGLTDAEFLDDPAEGRAIMVTDRRIMETGEPEQVEEAVALPDGTPAVWFSTKVPMRDADGDVVGLIGTSVDITASKAAEAALREREERLSQATRRLDAILNNTREAVFLMDHRQVCVYANAAAETLTGYRFDQMQGRPLHDVVHHTRPDGSHYPLEECPIDRAFPERAQTSGEELFVAPDGSFYPVAFTASPVLDEEGKPIGTVIEARSITEEKARDAALAESEARFRNMADHAPVMMWVTDPGGACTYLNRGWYDFTGQTEAGALGVGWLEATHPDDRAMAERVFAEANARREPFRIEYRLRRADGAWRWAIDAAAPRFGAAGEFLGYIGSVIDIDDRKAAETALRDRTAELEAILSSAPVGVAFFDRDHRWVRINEELAAVNGFPAADHIGQRMEQLLPVNAQAVGPVVDRIFATGETLRDIEVTGEVPHRPGESRHWLVNYYPVRDARGAIAAVGTWVVDITRRKQAEERYRTLFESIETGFCVVEVDLDSPGGRTDYRVVEANPAFYAQTGFPEAVLGRWLREAVPTLEEHWYDTYGRVARTGEAARFEQGSDVLGRWFDVYALRVGRPAERRVAILFNDISKRRQAELALRELNDTLEHRIAEAIAERERVEDALRQSQKMEAVGQLTGGIAHDFNNMLAAVIGSLDLLGRRIGEGDERARRYVEAAMEGARRAALLTQRLLAFSRQQPLRPEPVDVNRLVEGMSDLLGRSLGAGVRLETSLAGGLWVARADPNQLENVILNLAVNARDAMPDGGRLIIETANAHPGSHHAGDDPGVPAGPCVMIAVTDTGAGMTPEVAAKAFDPFFTTKPVGQGTGLGLSQVYGFVRQSGGHVRIESEPGRGTTVRVYLPRLRDPDAVAPPREAVADLPLGEPREVVLVVEDEAMVRQFTTEALRDLGYGVLEADGGEAALRLLDAHPEVALLFTDVVMPDMNGRRLADEALRRRPDLRVLFTTGYTRDAVVRDGVLEPGVQLLGKPFTVEQLAAKLREVLDGPAGGAKRAGGQRSDSP